MQFSNICTKFQGFANLHSVRGIATDNAINYAAGAAAPGDVYMFTCGVRMFNPTAYATIACPLAGELRAVDSTAMDFRCAHHEAAMIPRDGHWYSSWGETCLANWR